MDDRALSIERSELALLHELAAKIRCGNAPTTMEINQVLEVGFGRLMDLEAELSRVRRRDDADPAPGGGVDELLAQIGALRDALVELRTLSSPSKPPRIGYGFVLPRLLLVDRPGIALAAPGRP